MIINWSLIAWQHYHEVASTLNCFQTLRQQNRGWVPAMACLWACIRCGHVSRAVRHSSSSSPSGRAGGSPPITRPRGTAPTHCRERTHCRQSMIQRASLHTTSRRCGKRRNKMILCPRREKQTEELFSLASFIFPFRSRSHGRDQWCGWDALGPLAPLWCPAPLVGPAGPTGCPARVSPTLGSTDTQSLVRTSRSELERRGKKGKWQTLNVKAH